MTLDIYGVIYMISNFFMTYVLYKFMELFYTEKSTNKKTELVSYILYFVAITVLHLLVRIPIILMVSNLILFFILTYNYKGSLKDKVLTTLLIYLTLMCVETIILLTTGYLRLELLMRNEYQSILGIVVIRMVSYIVVLIIGSYKKVRSGVGVPTSYWLCIATIPIGTLYLLITIFISNSGKPVRILISTILVLIINFATFFLYEKISSIISDKAEKALIKQQNIYYEKQLELMRTCLKATHTIKHDLKNHITCIYILVKDNKKQEILDYLSRVITVINSEEGFACTGNIVVDSIINFKLQEAIRDEIAVTVDLDIPEKIKIPSFDITIILGNLLDNALNAVRKLENNRYINIKIKYTKGRMVLNIENSFNGRIITDNGFIVTSHPDKDNHGIGLESVREVLKKYNGTMEFKYDESKFKTALLVYME